MESTAGFVSQFLGYVTIRASGSGGSRERLASEDIGGVSFHFLPDCLGLITVHRKAHEELDGSVCIVIVERLL